jgi:hypothetical protein
VIISSRTDLDSMCASGTPISGSEGRSYRVLATYDCTGGACRYGPLCIGAADLREIKSGATLSNIHFSTIRA